MSGIDQVMHEAMSKAVSVLEEECEQESALNKQLKKKEKQIRRRYEAAFWSRIETERDLQRLTLQRELNTKKQEEAQQAIQITDNLQKMLEDTKQKIRLVQEQRTLLQKKRLTLGNRIKDAQDVLNRYSEGSEYLYSNQQKEISLLQQKVRSRTNIQSVLLSLIDNVDMLHQSLEVEATNRQNFHEILLFEAEQMRHRVAVAEHHRQEIQQTLESGLADRRSLLSDLHEISAEMNIYASQVPEPTPDEADSLAEQEATEKLSGHFDGLQELLPRLHDKIHFIQHLHEDTLPLLSAETLDQLRDDVQSGADQVGLMEADLNLLENSLKHCESRVVEEKNWIRSQTSATS